MNHYIINFLLMGLFLGSVTALLSNEVCAINHPNDKNIDGKSYFFYQINFQHKLYCDSFLSKPIPLNNIACFYNAPACWSLR
jgi:hypothetical protein